jgi:hypothetical protein
MKRIGVFSIVAGAAALTLLVPLTASATVSPSYTANCGNHRIAANEDDVPVYSGPESNYTYEHVDLAGQLTCDTGLWLSTNHRYTMCGVSRGNGYIRVYLNDKPIGYTPQACWSDQ